MPKKRGQTPPRDVRLQTRGRPGEIRPTSDRARKRRRANIVTTVIVVLLVGGVATAAYLTTRGDEPPAGLSTSPPPWPAELSNLSRRMAQEDIPAPGTEAFHNHVHLDVFVNGSRTPIPGNLGFGETVAAGLHAHDDTGVIHVEATEPFPATIGDIFTIWGVRFTQQCIGGLCADADRPLAVYVNGERVDDFVNHRLQEHDQIAVVYGEEPEEIPESYEFPENL